MSNMHWYPHNPSESAGRIIQLSLIEVGALQRLENEYLVKGELKCLTNRSTVGKPDVELFPDHSRLYRVCGAFSDAEMQAVDMVLENFFTYEDGFYRCERLDNLIEEAQAKHAKKVAASRAGVAAKLAKKNKEKTTRSTSGATAGKPDGQHNYNYNYNHSTKKNISNEILQKECEAEILTPDRFDEFWQIFPKQRAGSKQKAQVAWLKAIKRDSPDEIINGVISYQNSREVAEGYAKGAAAWLNDDRWLNDYIIPEARIVRYGYDQPSRADLIDKTFDAIEKMKGMS